MIKLNFLQQAIELSVDNGQLVKKKRVDGPIAFKLNQVPFIQITVPLLYQKPKLYIETAKPAATNSVARPKPIAAPTAITPNPEPNPNQKRRIQLGGNKKGLLGFASRKIRGPIHN